MKEEKRGNMGIAVVALLINIFLCPGLGSLIGGRIGTGVIQIILNIIGWALTVLGAITFGLTLFVAVPILIFVWIWALITGISLINKAR